MIDYKAAIGYLYLVRERIRSVDHEELYEYYLQTTRLLTMQLTRSLSARLKKAVV